MLFYIWRAQYPLFMAYHAMLVDGTGSGGELPPEKADRILVRPWHTQQQPFGKGCDELAPLTLPIAPARSTCQLHDSWQAAPEDQ